MTIREQIENKAISMGINLNYEPLVQMQDIRLLPESFWHESRQTGWGGSNEGELNGMGYNGIEVLAYEKILGTSPKVSDDTQFIFDYGHAMEWVMLKRYATINGYKFLTYTNYYVIVKSSEDVHSKYPLFKLAMDGVYSYVTQDEVDANYVLSLVNKEYPDSFIESRESNDPKDVRDITDKEHELYDEKGIVCVDRRQYRHSTYKSMLGDVDGLCITGDGERIGLECKTYGHLYKGTFNSGVLNETGTIKNPEYALQVQHYMEVLNLNRFDILACCGNNPNDFTITTVYRDLELGKELAENCESKWQDICDGIIPETNGLLKTDSLTKIMEMVNSKGIRPASILLPESLKTNIEEIEKLTETIDEKKYQIETLTQKKNKFIEEITLALESNVSGVIPMGKDYDYDIEVNYKGRETTRMDEKTFKANHPDLWEQYRKKSTSSPSFSFKKRFKRN